jgi:hypothetical protein
MATEKKITARQLREQAEALIAHGQMPTLGQLLKAVAKTREKYAPLILEARHK